MRMLAWIGLLLPDGLVNRTLIDDRRALPPAPWLAGQASSVIAALIYGYVPYLILPLFAVLDRIDRSVLEAGRDLGASPFSNFIHVTLPLSKNGILAAGVLIALPMFGDYYTNDVISNSPRTSMIGNQINLFFQEGTAADGRRVARASSSPCFLAGPDVVLPLDHGARVVGDEGVAAVRRVRDWFANPWGQPRLLGAITWLYMVWSIVPVRSRSCSRSTTGGRAASGRGSRRAGGGATRTTRSPRPRAAGRARAEPQARRPRHADRGAARRRPRHRPDALAGLRRAAGELPDAVPARDARRS